MPITSGGTEKRARRVFGPAAGLVVLMLAAACVGPGTDGVSRAGFAPGTGAADAALPPGGALSPEAGAASALIAELAARRSILAPQGPLSEVAAAVIEAGSGAGAAELRMARLRANAKARNWLPQIGPNVSLTSLNALAASLMLEQAIFDHGRRKAERAYAAADVEVAAVSLAADMNQRVFDGLAHYTRAEKARAQATVSAKAEGRLEDFLRIMEMRVGGGISDQSEFRVIEQKKSEMSATLSSDREAELSALAELAAMTSRPVAGVRGLQPVLAEQRQDRPLSVLMAVSEGARDVAEARVQRAGLLPGLGASAGLGAGGLNAGLTLGGAGLMGAGTRSSLEALDATAEVAERRGAEAAEAANRRIVALERQIAQIEARQAEGERVLAQTAAGFETAVEQYKVGRKSLVELVGLYDAYARLERDQVSLPHEALLLRLEIARDRGVLVDGGQM